MHPAEHNHQSAESRRHKEGGSSSDKLESDALDARHSLVQYALQGNYLAPIALPERILDVGYGTGRWLAEMAREFPHAELIGIDHALPEKETAQFPSNCHFLTGNMLDLLPFEDASFDFTHQRFRLFAIPLLQWQPIINELARVTRRGGWVELTEMNPTLQHMGPHTTHVIQLITQATSGRGLDPAIAQHLPTLLGTAGLKRVGTSIQLVPVGNWSGHSGALALALMLSMAREMQPQIAEQTQIEPEAFSRLTAQMAQEVEQYHTTLTFHIAYGLVSKSSSLLQSTEPARAR